MQKSGAFAPRGSHVAAGAPDGLSDPRTGPKAPEGDLRDDRLPSAHGYTFAAFAPNVYPSCLDLRRSGAADSRMVPARGRRTFLEAGRWPGRPAGGCKDRTAPARVTGRPALARLRAAPGPAAARPREASTGSAAGSRLDRIAAHGNRGPFAAAKGRNSSKPRFPEFCSFGKASACAPARRTAQRIGSPPSNASCRP